MEKKKREALAARLKRRRVEMKMNQERMAEYLGIAYSTYTKLETAQQSASLNTLINISQKMGLSLDYLVFGNGEDESADAKAEQAVRIIQECDMSKIKYTADMLINLYQQMQDKQ